MMCSWWVATHVMDSFLIAPKAIENKETASRVVVTAVLYGAGRLGCVMALTALGQFNCDLVLHKTPLFVSNHH